MWTNSACTSGSLKELILSTNAGGKVDSIPKMIPIFFTAGSLEAKLGQRRPENRCRRETAPILKHFRRPPQPFSDVGLPTRFSVLDGCPMFAMAYSGFPVEL